MGKTKVVLVSNTSWSFVKFRMTLITALLGNGYEVVLLAPEDEETPKLKASGARFIALRRLQAKGINPISDFLFTREMISIFRVEKPDLIVQYTIKPNVYGSFAARRLKIPHIAVVTGLGYTYIKGGWMTSLVSWMYRLAFKSADRVWFLNNDDRDLFVSRGLVKPLKTDVLPGEGIDALDRFNPTLVKAHSTPAQHGSKTRFIFVARLL